MLRTSGLVAVGILVFAAIVRLLANYFAADLTFLGPEPWVPLNTALRWSSIGADAAIGMFSLVLFSRLNTDFTRVVVLICGLTLIVGAVTAVVYELVNLQGFRFENGRYVVSDSTLATGYFSVQGVWLFSDILVAAMVLLLGFKLGAEVLVVGAIVAVLSIGLAIFNGANVVDYASAVFTGSDPRGGSFEFRKQFIDVANIGYLANRLGMAAFFWILSMKIKES